MSMPGPETKIAQATAVTGPNTPSPGTYAGCLVYFMNWSGDTLATFHVLSVSGPIKVYLQ